MIFGGQLRLLVMRRLACSLAICAALVLMCVSSDRAHAMTRLSSQTARSGFYPLSSLFGSDAEAQERVDVAFTQDVPRVTPEKMMHDEKGVEEAAVGSRKWRDGASAENVQREMRLTQHRSEGASVFDTQVQAARDLEQGTEASSDLTRALESVQRQQRRRGEIKCDVNPAVAAGGGSRGKDNEGPARIHGQADCDYDDEGVFRCNLRQAYAKDTFPAWMDTTDERTSSLSTPVARPASGNEHQWAETRQKSAAGAKAEKADKAMEVAKEKLAAAQAAVKRATHIFKAAGCNGGYDTRTFSKHGLELLPGCSNKVGAKEVSDAENTAISAKYQADQALRSAQLSRIGVVVAKGQKGAAAAVKTRAAIAALSAVADGADDDRLAADEVEGGEEDHAAEARGGWLSTSDTAAAGHSLQALVAAEGARNGKFVDPFNGNGDTNAYSSAYTEGGAQVGGARGRWGGYVAEDRAAGRTGAVEALEGARLARTATHDTLRMRAQPRRTHTHRHAHAQARTMRGSGLHHMDDRAAGATGRVEVHEGKRQALEASRDSRELPRVTEESRDEYHTDRGASGVVSWEGQGRTRVERRGRVGVKNPEPW